MRIPLTSYGAKEILLFGGCFGLLAALAVLFGVPWLAAIPVAGLVFVLSFFRDPERRIPSEAGVVVAPADGKVVAITDLEDEEYIEGPAKRIDIFLAVYNVHVNRAPIAGEVGYIKHRDGPYLNALNISAGAENQAKSVGILAEAGFKYLVRQIVGAIARRIVTAVKEGDRLDRGQRFGMLKFGSRTQLSFPADLPFTVDVEVGDIVKGGETILGRIGPVDGEGAR
jgi:phosphatidylserine decarboxylase